MELDDEMYEIMTSNESLESRVAYLGTYMSGMVAHLAEKGVIDISELAKSVAVVSADLDQLKAAARERYYKENPGAAMFAKIFKTDGDWSEP